MDERPQRLGEEAAALVCDLAAVVTTSLDLDEALTTIARRLAEALDVWECDFFEYLPEREELRAAACWSRELTPDDEAWLGQVFPLDGVHGLGPVVRDLVTLEEHVDDPDMPADDVALMEAWGEKSALSVPLVFEDSVLGVVSLIEKREPRRFSDGERQLLRTLAVPAAVAIHNAQVYRRLEERARQLDALLGAARALASSLDLDEVLDTVTRETATALDVSCCLIYEYVPERDSVAWRAEYDATRGSVSEDGLGSEYPLDEYPEDREILLSGRIVENHVDDPRIDPVTRRTMVENGELSCLTVPLRVEGEPLGLVEIVETRYDRHFRPDEVELARGLAEQAAVAIRNARLYRELESRNRQLSLLNDRLKAFVDLSEEMRGLSDEEQVMRLLGRVMDDVLGYRQWAAYLYDAGQGVYRVVSSIGDQPEVDAAQAGREIPARVLDGLVAAATPVSRSYFVDHRLHTWTDEEHHWFPASPLGERGPGEWHWDDTLFVPMRTDGGELLGYIEAYDPRDRQLPTVEDVRLLEVFAAKAAADLEVRRLHEALAEQARTDALTGLANRRHLTERLEEEVATARRYGTPLSLLMLDLDDFKPFNDRYGHLAGDRLLQEVAAILRRHTRDRVDVVGRYGGEEFVVVLPNTALAGGGRPDVASPGRWPATAATRSGWPRPSAGPWPRPGPPGCRCRTAPASR